MKKWLTRSLALFNVIDNVLVVSNGGEHGAIRKTGAAQMEKGFHKFEVKYFDKQWKAEFEINWIPPGFQEFMPIPEGILFHTISDSD